jgi:hypothetical protein
LVSDTPARGSESAHAPRGKTKWSSADPGLMLRVLEMDGVAEILGGTIELLRHGCGSRYG